MKNTSVPMSQFDNISNNVFLEELEDIKNYYEWMKNSYPRTIQVDTGITLPKICWEEWKDRLVRDDAVGYYASFGSLIRSFRLEWKECKLNGIALEFKNPNPNREEFNSLNELKLEWNYMAMDVANIHNKTIEEGTLAWVNFVESGLAQKIINATYKP